MARKRPAGGVPVQPQPGMSAGLSDNQSRKARGETRSHDQFGRREGGRVVPERGTTSGTPKGYRPNALGKEVIKQGQATQTWKSVMTLLSDHVCIWLITVLCVLAWKGLPMAAGMVIAGLGMAAITRFQRGLECMVHEGSHYNFIRGMGKRGKVMNDLLTDLLASYPVFATVRGFRASHWLHHEHFGEEDDPDLRRYKQLRIEYMQRARAGSFVAGMIVRILPYCAGWWMTLGLSPATLALGLVWHAVVWIAPLWLVGGPLWAVTIWLMFWMAPFAVILPFGRFLAESAKHQYMGNGTVFTATISNIGPVHRWLLHPHGDGYHLLHHLAPCVVHHRLRMTHEALVAADPVYGGMHKHRQHVFEEPIVGGC